MRFIVVFLVLIACTAPTFAQDREGFLGPFKPGMTIEQAQAAQPGWALRQHNFGLEEASLSGITWAGADYRFYLNFQNGRLFQARAWRTFSISEETMCRQAFDELLAQMELQFGPLDGEPNAAAGDVHVAPSGFRIITARGAVHALSAFKHGLASVAATWSSRTSEDGTVLMTCTTAASATAAGDLLEEILPAAPLPDDIAAARLIDAPPTLNASSFAGRFYPPRALSYEIEGRVELDCLVIADGALRCVILRETPPGFEFGAAALRVAADARVEQTFHGEPTLGRRIHMIIPFRLAD